MTKRLGDRAPILVVPVLALLAVPLMSPSTWLTLTAAGIAMGMMLFLMAAGLSLIFGLMDVLNFAHGAFITLGAFVAVSVLGVLSGLAGTTGAAANLAALGLVVLAAALAGGALGYGFERVLVRPIYGAHLTQILITMGGAIVLEQVFLVIWGAEPLPLARPAGLRGSVFIAGATIETFRLVATALGLIVFVALELVLNRTRLGLIVRAGVEDREMVEALGYRVNRLFVAVFIGGTALAGVGGAMWAVQSGMVTAAIGGEMTVLVFIVVIIGGLGSVAGCFVAALLVGLTANYAGFLAPKLALGSDVALLLLALLWRPRGLFPRPGA